MTKPTDYRSDEYPMKTTLSTDSEGLEGWGNKIAGTVDYVSKVKGSEACEVPEFVATKHELIQIAKYWDLRHLDNDFYYFLMGSEWREAVYAGRRIDRIAEILPEKELNQAIEEAVHDFRQKLKISDVEWEIFKNGTTEQWEAYQEKVWQEAESRQADQSSPGLEK